MDLEYPIWLNEEFVQKVLRLSEKDDSIKVTSMKLSPATKPGDNFGSLMFRTQVEFKGVDRVTESKSLIVKIQPKQQPNYLSANEMFGTEASMMMDTLIRMNQLFNDVSPFSAKGLYWQEKNPVILVIEDLVPRGFRMIRHGTELDLEHLILTIRNLARFHASSIALGERNPAAVRKYNKGFYHANQKQEFWDILTGNMKSVSKCIANVEGLGPRYAEKISKLRPHAAKKAIEAAACKEGEFNVLCHGDLWSNNMLYRYDNEDKPIDHAFVDFQISIYTSPAYDLHYLLGTSLRDESMREDLLFEYHSILKSTMSRLNCEVAIPSLEELKRILRERGFFELVVTFLTLPIILQTEEVGGLDPTKADEDGFELSSIRSDAFLNILKQRIFGWEAAGLLDVE